MKTVYLATPIDQGDRNSQRLDVGRSQLRQELRNFTLFDPARAWTVGEPCSTIQAVNDQALAASDVLVALVLGDVPSVGVPTEIERARYLGVPAVVWSPDYQPVALLASPHVTIVRDIEAVRAAVLAASTDHFLVRGGELERAYPDDAGFDLPCLEGHKILAGEMARIPTGRGVRFPRGMWGLILPRSSTIGKGLMVTPTVIDPGWRGDLYVHVTNVTRSAVQVEAGSRLAQIVPFPCVATTLPPQVLTGDLGPGSRGTNGFGSSGV